MIITHAIWEKRNLGVDSNEIIIEKSDYDNLELTKSMITGNTLEYTVVKVPAGMTEIMFVLEDMGFHFIECMIRLSHDLKSHEKCFPESLKKIAARCSFRKMDEIELVDLFIKIRAGIFNTDRIYLDPYFDENSAAERYIGWIQDAYKSGMGIYELSYNNKPMGFIQFSIDEYSEARGTLIGIYRDNVIPGAGGLIYYTFLREIVTLGAKKIKHSYVSCNNPKSLRVHFAMGYQYEDSHYVYIKHILH